MALAGDKAPELGYEQEKSNGTKHLSGVEYQQTGKKGLGEIPDRLFPITGITWRPFGDGRGKTALSGKAKPRGTGKPGRRESAGDGRKYGADGEAEEGIRAENRNLLRGVRPAEVDVRRRGRREQSRE